MKKKKFLNGTGLGSTSEPATRSSSAPIGAATGVVELDDASLASVSGGRTLTDLPGCLPRIDGTCVVVLRSYSGIFDLDFDSTDSAHRAFNQLNDLLNENVSASTILDYLGAAHVTPTNADQFSDEWD